MNKAAPKLEEKKVSDEQVFNSGIAFLQRLHDLKLAFHRNMQLINYDAAESNLLSLRGELYFKYMTDEEKEQCDDFINKSQSFHTCSGASRRFQHLPKGRKYRHLLFQWFTFLCMVTQRRGLEMPEKPSDLSGAIQG